MVRIQGVDVGTTGYGLLGLTVRPGPEEQTFAAMKAALSCGAVCWNGADFYGPPTANSLVLLNKYFSRYPEDANKVLLSIKGGINPDFSLDCTPEGIRKSVENCIKALPVDVKAIDIYQCARVDPNAPIETSMGTLVELVNEGKIKGIGICEARPGIFHYLTHEVPAITLSSPPPCPQDRTVAFRI